MAAVAAPLGARSFTSRSRDEGERARTSQRHRTATAGALPPRRRRGRARRAGGALHPARPRPRPALHLHRRADRRPAPGRQSRPDQGDRPLRARPRHEVHELCRAHHPRRAQAPLPRQGLGAARAARPAGALARAQPRDRGAVQGARPLAHGPRGRRRRSAARVEQALEAQEAAASYEAASLDAPDLARRRRGRAAGRPLGRRATPPTSSSRAATPSRAPGGRCRTSSARWSSCASCTTSRSARSATGSATRRCTCRDCCAVRSIGWRPLQPPPERRAFSTAKPSQSLLK